MSKMFEIYDNWIKVFWLVICYLLNLNHFVNLDCGCNTLRRELKDGFGQKLVQEEYCNIKDKEEFHANMFLIPTGTYLIGTEEPVFETDSESPVKTVKLRSFYMDKYEVSNKEFKKFVEATNYITDAERFNDSFVFHELLTSDLRKKYEDYRVARAPWWYKVNGTNWKHPYGPESNIDTLWNHPVVHVSWKDAVSYCKWMRKRLPTEAEWEVACRGGKKGKLFPWGNKLNPRNEHWLNIWQGKFPDKNTVEDGYEFTCPVNKFRQNDYDMYNIVGNVWEWTSDLWDLDDKINNPNRVKKGGSYLCHKSYCYRYRCAARSQNTEDSSAGNLGFRCAINLP